ncbi:MAG: DoxX family protein [Candidatus Paceibacterota bacterium]
MILKEICSIIDEPRPIVTETSWALLAIRVTVGIFFMVHGYKKFFGEGGLSSFTDILAGIGFPAAATFAFLVAFAQLFGGLAIILGVLTRFSAFWLTLISVYGWITVKGLPGTTVYMGDLELMLSIGMTLALMLVGPGVISLSSKLKREDIVVSNPNEPV